MIESPPRTTPAGVPSAKRPLRVCMLIPRLRIGGAEFQMLYLLKNLPRDRFSVTLCTMAAGDAAMEREAAGYVEAMRCIGFRWRSAPVSFVRLARFLRAGRFDVLHAHLPLADAIGRLAARLAGVPVAVTTEHGKHLWKRGWHLALERLLNPITDMRICVSRDILDIRMRREGTPRSKLVYVPNAVDPAAFASPKRDRAALAAELGWAPSDPLIVTVGRLVVAKNYPLLVDAMALLRETQPAARCLIVGDGDCRPGIEARIAERGCAANVRIAGYRRDVADLLAAADIFVLSSVREGLPVSLLEAMAAGAAVVATRVGGIPDAIADEKNGLLVPPDNPAALAGALGRLVREPEMRRRFAEAARADVAKRFSMQVIAGRIGDLYEELCSSKAATRRGGRAAAREGGERARRSEA